MNRKASSEEYPLTSLQQGIILHSFANPKSRMYITQFIFRMEEKIDVFFFNQAWEKLISDNAILRSRIEWKNLEEPKQIVEPKVEFKIQYSEMESGPRLKVQEKLEDYLANDRERGIDLTNAPWTRVALFRVRGDEYICVWTLHHSMLDGRSMTLLIEDVFDNYESLITNKPIQDRERGSFFDYVEWIRKRDLSHDEMVWRNQLNDITAPTEIPLKAVKNKEAKEGRINIEEIKIDKETTEELKRRLSEYKVSMNNFFQALWSLLLHHYTGNDEICFGLILSGRKNDLEKPESMVGLLINTVPLVITIREGETFLGLINRSREKYLQIRKFIHTPLEKIHKWSQIPEGTPLFNTTIVYDKLFYDSYFRRKGGKWLKRNFDFRTWTHYPVNLMLFEELEEFYFRMEYDEERIGKDFAQRILGHVKSVIGQVSGDLRMPVSQIDILSKEERNRIVMEWNRTEKEYPNYKCLHEVFEERVERNRGHMAVRFRGQALTYDELNRKANQLGNYLRILGVKPECLVGIYMERSLEMVISIYGILKAGGAYLPIDPEYPAGRVKFVMEDAGVRILLTQKHLINRFPVCEAKIICVDGEWEEIARQDPGNLHVKVEPWNLAYVIYTSGSTGLPKGAMNEHKGITNRIFWMQDQYSLKCDDAVLQKTPYTFDVSVWEFLWPLCFGASLVVAEPGLHRDTASMIRAINENHITTIHFVPSMMQMFLEDQNARTCKSLRRVICSGETLPFELKNRFFECLNTELHNLYGPTEAAVDVTYWNCSQKREEEIVPIGRPVGNTKIYILNKYMKAVPVGIAGELHIGGIQVGRGYLNREELTREKFIEDPFEEERKSKLYKTGDLCRYLPDGNIEYLGRNDFQVKIRGLRVEIGEIESLIRQIDGVKEAIVDAKEDETGGKKIFAYFTTFPNKRVDVEEMRGELRRKLPDYMVPAAFARLESFPLTMSGKIDRRSLPALGIERKKEKSFVEARGAEEKVIKEIWEKLLGVKNISLMDNFFELGGNSLLLLRALNRIREIYGGDITIVDMFNHPTIADMANLVGRKKKEIRRDEISRRAQKQKESMGRLVERDRSRKLENG